jgi:hypothetical protein
MSASFVSDASWSGVLLQQEDGLGRIVQLIAIALFLFGPVVLRVLQRLIGGTRAGQQPPPNRRAARRAEAPDDPGASDAETKGRDLWRQLMELEERAEEEAQTKAAPTTATPTASAAPTAAATQAPAAAPVRRPSDPLADPDVELTQRRLRQRAAPVQPPRQEVQPPRQTVAEKPSAILELTPVLERVPDESSIEAARSAAPLPVAALGNVAPPQLVERGSQALRRGPSREELRRVLVLSEVLAPPVSLRAAGRGGHDPLA